MTTTPTTLSLKALRDAGYTAAVVEHWKPPVSDTISEPGSASTLPALVEPDGRPNVSERTCSVVDCEHPWFKREWCKLHYARWSRHGDPLIKTRRPSVFERLQRRLSSSAKTHNGTPCMEWQGARLPKGYGKIGDRRQKGTGWALTHRIAYELAFGPLPADKLVCHHCDNPPCCNPDHLFLGTHTANVADMWTKGRQRMPWQP